MNELTEYHKQVMKKKHFDINLKIFTLPQEELVNL